MVRSCVIDQGVSKFIDDLISEQGGPQVGLIIGRVGGKDVIVDLLPTPADEDAPVECTAVSTKKGRTGKGQEQEPALVVNSDLILDHAALVSRMLPGGIWIAGLFLYSPHTSFQSVRDAMCRALKDLKKQCPSPGWASDDMLLLHISSVDSSISLWNSQNGECDPTSLKKVDHKFASCPEMSCMRCYYPISWSVPLDAAVDTRKRLWKHLIEHEAKIIMDGELIQGGGLLDGSQEVGRMSDSGFLDVDLLCRMSSANLDANSAGIRPIHGRGALHGVMEGRAYIPSTELAEDAARVLKEDLCNTLKIRFELLEEDAKSEGKNESKLGKGPLRHSFTVDLARRVWFNWKCGICLCDHLGADEDVATTIENAMDLASFSTITPDQVQDEEPPSTSRPELTGWNPCDASQDFSALGDSRQMNESPASALASCPPSVVLMAVGAAVFGFAGVFLAMGFLDG